MGRLTAGALRRSKVEALRFLILMSRRRPYKVCWLRWRCRDSAADGNRYFAKEIYPDLRRGFMLRRIGASRPWHTRRA